jgi:YfiH family protein
VIEVYTYDIPDSYDDIIAFTTTKNTKYDYSFSLALHTGENKTMILSNRQQLLKDLELEDYNIILANQTHSCNISIVNDSISRGWNDENSAILDTDAIITNQKGLLLGILTADCVPILLYDRTKGVISAIHAGWRGSACGIVKKTIAKMQEIYDSNPKDIYAIISPSIGKCCYEVDLNVAEHFEDIIDAYTQVGDKYMLDLPHINKIQLIQSGLDMTSIHLSGICTSCNNNRFFSYRKECGCSGRFLSIIGMR